MAMSASALGAKLLAAATGGEAADTAAKWNKIAEEIINEVKKATIAVPAVGLVSGSPGAPVSGSAQGTIS